HPDLHSFPTRRSSDLGSAAARALLKCAAAVERAERYVGDRFIGACDESIENRRYAIQVLLVQIDFHVFGDEVSRVQRGLHRVLRSEEHTSELQSRFDL